MTRIAILSAIVFFNAVIPGAAFAEEATSTPELATVTIRLSVVAPGGTLYDDDITVEECPVVEGTATTTVHAKCALDQSGLAVSWSSFGDDYFLDSVEGQTNDFENGAFWNWWTDLEYGQTALNKHELSEGERVLVALGLFPLKIESDTATPAEGSDATVTAYAFGFDDAFNPVWNAADGATIYANGATTTASALGTLVLNVATLDHIDVHAEKDGYVASDTLTLIPRSARANVTVRNGTDIAFAGVVNLASPSAPDIELSPSNATSTYPTPARSVLAVLADIDGQQDTFSITDLQYFSSFNSFFVNCITITEEACGAWQYVVNDIYPAVGMDGYALSDSDTAYIYFGSPRRVSLATSTVEVGVEFTALAEAYDPVADTYGPAEGYTLGVTQENPDDFFSPIIIATSTADAEGKSSFALPQAGIYAVGIAEDFFFPSSALTVTEATPTEEAEDEEDPPPPEGSPSGGGGGGGSAHTVFNSSQALSFLAGKQNAEGSFPNELLSDWVALAFAARDAEPAARELLTKYLKTHTPPSSTVTDYERHAMALMALDINPYNGAPADYITPIVNAFDGVQFGEPSLVNDDIFALIPLLRAGYGTSDEMIIRGAAFIVSKQKASGSWESSVDVTSAAVQALAPLASLPGVESALANAKQYLNGAQRPDSGWGNSFSTSWTVQAIAAYGESPAQWAPSGLYPTEYLALRQSSDGGMESTTDDENTRIWSTAYAVPAAEGKTWHTLLHEFQKPTASPSAPSGGSGLTLGASTSTPQMTNETPGATEETATTTPDTEIAPEPEPEAPAIENITDDARDAVGNAQPVQSDGIVAQKPDSDVDVEVPMSLNASNQLASVAAVNLDWFPRFLTWMLTLSDSAVRFLMGFLP